MELLLPQEKYLEAGVHIGTKMKHGSMKEFIYKTREDGLHVLDLKKLDDRLKMTARMLAKFPAEKVFIVGNKENARQAIKKFCELAGFQPLTGRFTPGRFTNPSRSDFQEPALVLVVDPSGDRQAVKESFETNTPVIALCDTNNLTKYVDLVVPTNNKGRKAIALIFWVLAREVLKLQEKIASNEEYKEVQESFEA
jgi:small subunit ribosomal protein S2